MKKNKKGSILIFTLIVMSMILVTALTLSTTTIIERKASSITRSSAAAIQGADAGLEYILREFRNYNEGETYDEFITSLSSSPPVSSYSIYCDDSSHDDSGDLIIKYSNPEQSVRITAQRKIISGTPPNEAVTYVDIACDDNEALHNVASFKSVGEDKIAKRALRIDMGRPIERGLVAFWDFEDYQNKRDIEDLEYSATDAAKDQSINGNAAYLCHDQRENVSTCKRGNSGRMHPGGDLSAIDEPKYNEFVSWFGKELTIDGSKKYADDNGKGIAKSDIDDSEQWAMEFNIKDNDGNKEDTPSEYLFVKDDDSFDYMKDKSFSISLWVRSNNVNHEQDLMRKGEDSDDEKFVIKIKNKKIQLTVNDGNDKIEFSSAETLSNKKWYHVVMTVKRDGSKTEVTGYIDGSYDDSVSSTAIDDIGNDQHLKMGTNNAGDDRFFIGQMDDVRIYNRVLSTTEVITLCRQGKDSKFPGACPSMP